MSITAIRDDKRGFETGLVCEVDVISDWSQTRVCHGTLICCNYGIDIRQVSSCRASVAMNCLGIYATCRRFFSSCSCVTANIFAVDVISAGINSLVVCRFRRLSSTTIVVHLVTNFYLLHARVVHHKLSVFVVTFEHVLKRMAWKYFVIDNRNSNGVCTLLSSAMALSQSQ